MKIEEYLLLCDLCKSAGKVTTFKTEEEARKHLADDHGILEFYTLVPIVGSVPEPEPKKTRDVEETLLPEPPEPKTTPLSDELIERIVKTVRETQPPEPKTEDKKAVKRTGRAKVLTET